MNNINILENYKETFDYTKKDEVIKCYIAIVKEYLKLCGNNLVIQDNGYYLFILKRGLQTITHCFKMLFMYSKNLDIVEQNCNKGICYYVEFMGQIGEDSNSYLQLNSKDATLFVYKKILFDIDEEFRKKYTLTHEEREYLNNINAILDVYIIVLNNLFDLEDKKDKKIFLKNSCESSITILKNVIKFNLSDYNINLLNYFSKNIKKYVTVSTVYINMCNLFLKKTKKKDLSMELLINKFLLMTNKNISNLGDNKLVNWFYQV
jgi:hypothetical protein